MSQQSVKELEHTFMSELESLVVADLPDIEPLLMQYAARVTNDAVLTKRLKDKLLYAARVTGLFAEANRSQFEERHSEFRQIADLLQTIIEEATKLFNVYEDHTLPRMGVRTFVRIVKNEENFRPYTRQDIMYLARQNVRDLRGEPFNEGTLSKELSRDYHDLTKPTPSDPDWQAYNAGLAELARWRKEVEPIADLRQAVKVINRRVHQLSSDRGKKK